jgi:iron only hydrogenase large subunit-like protein
VNGDPGGYSGSGGYAEFVFRMAARELYGIDVGEIVYEQPRRANKDLLVATLQREGQVLLRCAIANGFKNIQHVVRDLKIGKHSYDFVEIMACPSGCINGGGQIRPTSLPPREHTELVLAAYKQAGNATSAALQLYHELHSTNQLAQLHTAYHAVPKTISNPLAIKW